MEDAYIYGKSATKNVYKHTFWAKAEMGSHVRIKKYDCFYLVFPNYNKDDYSFDKLLTQIDNYGNPLPKENRVGNPQIPQKVEGSDLQINYPSEHQVKNHINYLSKPKKLKECNSKLHRQ